MMEPIKYSVKDVLVRQGIANGLAGRPNVHGIGAGLPVREDQTDPLTAQAQGEDASRSGIGEKAERTKRPASFQGFGERQHRGRNEIVGDPFLRLVANNVDVVTTRQRRGRVRLSLVVA